MMQDATGKPVSRISERKLQQDRKSTRLNSSHLGISYAVFCLKKKKSNHSDKICRKNHKDWDIAPETDGQARSPLSTHRHKNVPDKRRTNHLPRNREDHVYGNR